MCGICGIACDDVRRAPHPADVIAMRDTLEHRGPDDAGHYVSPGIGLGSRRLAILDLSPNGHMPMASADGRFRIVYNGEIYNYRDLRRELEGRGHVFRSGSDTEVLLALYCDEGPRMLDRLNGMFAFAVWDTTSRSLFAARDRMGVKPFYYARHGGALLFASEEKALFAAGVPAVFDTDRWTELMCFRYVAGERTPFLGVARLLPGHCLTFSQGVLRTTRWWDYAGRVSALRARRQKAPVEWFRDTFDSAVSLRRISDVPVGVLLSGGLDSGSVAASLAGQAGNGVESFTVRFAEKTFDEGELAAQVAARWSLQRHELSLTPDEVLARMARASWLNDEPLAHASDIHLNAIAEFAKPRVTVLLSGEGADELLGGYMRYLPLRHPALLTALRPGIRALTATRLLPPRVTKLARFMRLGDLRTFGLFNACEVLPDDLRTLGVSAPAEFPYREQIWADAERLYPGDLMRQAMFSDQHTFLCSLLDRNDRMTMGASIECRVPFLDYRLVEGLAALPSDLFTAGPRKRLLRDALGSRLPAAVQQGGKWGFGVPWSLYLRTIPGFRAMVETLPDRDPVRHGPFSRGPLKSAIREFLAGNEAPAPVLRQLVMMAAWHAAFFESTRGAPVSSPRLAPADAESRAAIAASG